MEGAGAAPYGQCARASALLSKKVVVLFLLWLTLTCGLGHNFFRLDKEVR